MFGWGMESHAKNLNKPGPGGATPLMVACMQGDAAIAGALIEAGADPAAEGMAWDWPVGQDEVDEEYEKFINFPLCVAVREGNTAIAELLLGCNGVSVNQGTSDTGVTALMLACRHFSTFAMIKLLLAHDGIEVNKARTDDGSTPLFIACDGGHVEAMKLLLAQDCIEVNKACIDDGQTPLYTMCYDGHVEAIKLLLAHDGIEVNKAKPNDGETPLSAACYHGHADSIKLLLAQDGIEVNKARTDGGATPLYVACHHGHVEAIKLLLAHDGIEVNKACTDDGSTPLFIACYRGHVDAIKLLLAHGGIEVNNARTESGKTPLYIACYRGHVDAIKLLLAQDGIEVNKARTENGGATPLSIACNQGHVDAIKLLLAHDGIEVNKAATDNRLTPLHSAALNNHLLIAQYLVLHGANLSATNHNGRTPAELAARQGHSTIADWLAAVAGWSQLKIAAGLRLHREAAGMLRQGRIDAASWTVPEMLAAIATSKTAPAALQWEDAAPVCHATIKLVADATRGWHRTTHWLHHSNVREAVFAVLVVADRLQRKQDALPPARTEIWQRPRRARAAYSAARSTVLPVLPPEIWFHLMQFFQRVWWA